MLSVVLFALFTVAASGQADVCDGAGVRPVLAVHGFRSGPLFDSANDFASAFPVSGLDGELIADPEALALPLQFDGLVQANTSIGPEAFEGDEFPVMNSSIGGQIIETVVFGEVKDLVSTWDHPVDPAIPLFYTMAWDWRRDLWEQAERVLRHVSMIRDTTSCRPLIVAHSNGGRLVYTALARYGVDLGQMLAGVLYGAPNMVPMSGVAPGAPEAFAGDDTPAAVVASWAAVYSSVPPPDTVCTNAETLLATETSTCTAPPSPATDAGLGELRTGLVCDAAACGKPASFGANQSFYLPVDLLSAKNWEEFGLGLSAARLALGESPALSPMERTFLATALDTAGRVGNLFKPGPQLDDVQAVHPPGLVIAVAVEEALTPRSIACEPNGDVFGAAMVPPGQARCSSIQSADLEPGDGLLPASASQMPGAGWEGIVDVAQLPVLPPDIVASIANGTLPLEGLHAGVLSFRSTPAGTPLDCATVPPVRPANPFPFLEQALCALVQRADAGGAAAAAAATGPAAAPAPAPAPGAAGAGTRDVDGEDIDASAARSLHAAAAATFAAAAAAAAAVLLV